MTAQRVSQRQAGRARSRSARSPRRTWKSSRSSIRWRCSSRCPNITFTKTNFTTFQLHDPRHRRSVHRRDVRYRDRHRGQRHAAGDDPPVRKREFFDLERVEVLRGPQGTLFGRNATSGVVNFITAKPDLSGIHSAGEFEYGNYDSKQVKGMFNLPITGHAGYPRGGAVPQSRRPTRTICTTTPTSTAATCIRSAARYPTSRRPIPGST